MSSSPSFRDLFFALAFVMLLAAGLALARPYAVPIAVAVLIWFLINAMAEAMQRAVPRAPWWVVLILAVALLFGAIGLMGSIVAGSLAALGAGVEGLDAALVAALNGTLARFGLPQRLDLEMLHAGIDLERLFRLAFDTVRGFASDVSLIFLYVMFLLIDQRFYRSKLAALVPNPDRRAALEETLRDIADTTRTYLWLMTAISAGVGVLTGLVCAVFGVPGAAFWGFLAFALNYIPTIGSILAVAIPSVYALLSLPSDTVLLGIVPLLSAVQFTAGEIVLPRVMGRRLNLSAFVILLSLVVWGALWGPAGMFLAIPIMVILTIVLAAFPATRPIAVALSREGQAGPVR